MKLDFVPAVGTNGRRTRGTFKVYCFPSPQTQNEVRAKKSPKIQQIVVFIYYFTRSYYTTAHVPHLQQRVNLLPNVMHDENYTFNLTVS